MSTIFPKVIQPRPVLLWCLWLVLWSLTFKLLPELILKMEEASIKAGGEVPDGGAAIAGSMIGLCILTPIWIIALWLILRKSPSSVSWVEWSSDKMSWSFFWTIICFLFLWLDFILLKTSIEEGLSVHVLATIGWAILLVGLRAVLVSKLQSPVDK